MLHVEHDLGGDDGIHHSQCQCSSWIRRVETFFALWHPPGPGRVFLQCSADWWADSPAAILHRRRVGTFQRSLSQLIYSTDTVTLVYYRVRLRGGAPLKLNLITRRSQFNITQTCPKISGSVAMSFHGHLFIQIQIKITNPFEDFDLSNKRSGISYISDWLLSRLTL